MCTVPFYCTWHDGFGERLCNHWLNYFTKKRNLSEISFLYKEYISAAIEIKNCSGISKPVVLLIQRTNSLFSVLFSNGGMLVFSTAIILYIVALNNSCFHCYPVSVYLFKMT